MHKIIAWWSQVWPNALGGALAGGPLYVWQHLRVRARLAWYVDEVANVLEAHRKVLEEMVGVQDRQDARDQRGGGK